MSLSGLYPDLYSVLFKFLSDSDKCRILRLSKFFYNLRYLLVFSNEYKYSRVKHLFNIYNFEFLCLNKSLTEPLPVCVKKIIIDIDANWRNEKTNYRTLKKYLPSKITHLTFGWSFNESSVDYIPASVKYLTFGPGFDNSIKDIEFNNVTHLFFGYNFNQPLENYIPATITHLIFGSKFNQPIQNSIPDSVTHLTFGYRFNQSIQNSIPDSVTHLTFGYNFNQSIQNSIPNSVTHLSFGYRFNQSIQNCIPDSVTHLTLYDYQNFKSSNLKCLIYKFRSSYNPFAVTNFVIKIDFA